MLRRTIAVALMSALLPLIVAAQTPPQSPAPAAPEKPAAHEPAKTYIPGLEQFMNVILIEHNKLWFAARAGNWPLADYELGEIKEVMGDVQDVVPVFKNLPLADMLDAVITKEIVDLEKAIAAKDLKAFSTGYDKLNAACNACHQATGNEFIVIKRPTRPVFTNQAYSPRE